MKGAEDEGVRDNPAVHSKFDRSRGKGIPAPHISHPGGTAPITGTKVAGHTEHGAKLPKHVKYGGSDKVG